MDPVLALAILSLGAFVMVLITTIYYLTSVRPRLLEPVSLAAVGMLDERLHDELAAQRTLIAQLNTALEHHTTQLTAAAAREPASGLQEVLSSQKDTVQTLTGLLHEQAEKLAGVDARIAQQGTRLERLETHLSAQTDSAPRGADPQLATLIQAQADQLLVVSDRLEAWSQASTERDASLAEHARMLAELDREMAAHAQTMQTLDTKVSEHTTMLLNAASERREQSGILQTLQTQIASLFPILEAIRARARHSAGPTRLTDIKGIGPVYAGRLYEAGIQTFKQLATLTPEEILTLMNEPKWRARSIDAESWIEQAQHLASQREKVETVS
jgi:predicted flap endonuclease-1-like 5' DNA nuclease